MDGQSDLPLAIVGAGPYGLSIAAHSRSRGVPFRIFRTPMHRSLAPNIAITCRSIANRKSTPAKASISPVRRWPNGSAARALFWRRSLTPCAHVFAGDRLHGDDTPVPVLEPGKEKTKAGRLRSYVRDGRPWAYQSPPAVAYFYSPDRKGEHPQAHLKSFRGVLHAAGYAGFRDLYEPKKDGEAAPIVEAACLAHVRRKFFDLATGPTPIAEEALRRIGEL